MYRCNIKEVLNKIQDKSKVQELSITMDLRAFKVFGRIICLQISVQSISHNIGNTKVSWNKGDSMIKSFYSSMVHVWTRKNGTII